MPNATDSIFKINHDLFELHDSSEQLTSEAKAIVRLAHDAAINHSCNERINAIEIDSAALAEALYLVVKKIEKLETNIDTSRRLTNELQKQFAEVQ